MKSKSEIWLLVIALPDTNAKFDCAAATTATRRGFWLPAPAISGVAAYPAVPISA